MATQVFVNVDEICKSIDREMGTRLNKCANLLANRLRAAAPRGPNRANRKRAPIRDGIKTWVGVTRRGEVASVITAPFPSFQVEYGHMSNGQRVPAHPWFWPVIDNSEGDIQAIMGGNASSVIPVIDNGNHFLGPKE